MDGRSRSVLLLFIPDPQRDWRQAPSCSRMQISLATSPKPPLPKSPLAPSHALAISKATSPIPSHLQPVDTMGCGASKVPGAVSGTNEMNVVKSPIASNRGVDATYVVKSPSTPNMPSSPPRMLPSPSNMTPSPPAMPPSPSNMPLSPSGMPPSPPSMTPSPSSRPGSAAMHRMLTDYPKPPVKVTERGVRFGYLLKLKELGCVDGEWTIQEVVERFVRPKTAATKCCLFDVIPETHTGRPRFFISHTWSVRLKDLLTLLQSHFLEDDDTLLWLDIVAINQHPYEDKGCLLQDDVASLASVVQATEQTLLCLDEQCVVLTRIWCLYEVGALVATNVCVSLHV
eukprot:gene3940-14017_t